MTAAARPGTAPGRSPVGTARTWAAGYLVLAAAGLVGTWYHNLRFTPTEGENYLQAWFANPASSSAAVDVIVTAVVACVFYVRESRRLGWRWTLVLVPLTFLVALAFTFPLFLALRELALARAPLQADVEPQRDVGGHRGQADAGPGDDR